MYTLEDNFEFMNKNIGNHNFHTTINHHVPITPCEVLCLTSCKDCQTSQDLCINDKYCGAFTYALLQVLKQNNYNVTIKDLLGQIRDLIATQKISDQIPCIDFGKSCNIDNFKKV